jgi:hypothetical protein
MAVVRAFAKVTGSGPALAAARAAAASATVLISVLLLGRLFAREFVGQEG